MDQTFSAIEMWLFPGCLIIYIKMKMKGILIIGRMVKTAARRNPIHISLKFLLELVAVANYRKKKCSFGISPVVFILPKLPHSPLLLIASITIIIDGPVPRGSTLCLDPMTAQLGSGVLTTSNHSGYWQATSVMLM